MNAPCCEREERISMLLSDDLPPESRREMDAHLRQCRACSEYLRELREDDRRLDALVNALAPTVEGIERRVLAHVIPAPAPRRPISSRLWEIIARHRLASATALASLVLAAIAGALLNSPRTLHAQILKALEKARTAHVTGSRIHDGQWRQSMEVWYERGAGVVEQETRDGKISTRIDNGEHQWIHKGGTPYAVKSKSADRSALGVIAKLLNLEEIQRQAPGGPADVKTVEGREYRIFSHSSPDGKTRMDIWLDKDTRVCAWEKFRQMPAGEWESYQKASVEYDVPVEKSRFAPEFGPGVTVIGGNELWDKRFDLKDAIFKKEAFGLAYAVHEVKRCENGLVYVVSSLRPTEATVKEFAAANMAQGAGRINYGDFQLDSSWERLTGGKERSYQPWTLATARHDGFEAQWSILIPKGSWPEKMDEVILSAYIYSREKLQEKNEKSGGPWYQRFRPLAILPLPERTTALPDIIAAVHDELLQMEPVMKEAAILGASVRDPNDSAMSSRSHLKPSHLSRDEFERICQTELNYLKALK